jgi:hypothetical protein
VKQLDPHVAYHQGEMIVVNLVGAAMPLREGIARLIELTAHDQAVQLVRRIVAVEPIVDVAMGDDAGSRDLSCIGFLVEEPGSPTMVDMAVRVDHRMNRAIVPTAQSGECLARGLPAPRVHKHQPGIGADGAGVAE